MKNFFRTFWGPKSSLPQLEKSERKREELLQSQKMEAIGQLAGGVAHDFNNQLVVIMGYCDFLLEEIPPSDPKRKEVMEIKRAAERSTLLTRQLLVFARKQIFNTKVFHPNILIRDLEMMLKRLITEDIQFETVLYPEVWAIKMDPAQLEQVLVNLVVNARDAMSSGGKLSIKTQNLSVSGTGSEEFSVLKTGEYVILSIIDTGIGITDDIKAHLFEPFFTTKGQGRGTGLGLATSYGILKQSGGTILFKSKPGLGSTFHVVLPRSTELLQHLVAQKRSRNLPRGTETVLLIEDEPGVKSLIAAVLRKQGYQVIEAENGERGMDEAIANQHLPIHLLITDVVMPEMNGKEIADRMRILSPATKVIFISGYTEDVIVRHGIKEASIQFLQKPFSPTALSFKVREVLDQ